MNPDREAKAFLASAAAMEQFNAAVSVLRGLGFERIIRRLGEPVNLQPDHPMYAQAAAAQHAENTGWYKAVDVLFNFQEVVGGIPEGVPADPDYGAKEMVQERMGYTDEELRDV